MGYKVAVVGATGNVGREMMQTMVERKFPADEVVALPRARSVGKEVAYGDDTVLKCQDLATYDFTGTDIVLSSPGASVSAEYSPKAAAAGAVVVDNTSHFRMDPDVPLVVPEVNPQAIAGYTKKGIIANPNCSTIQMLVALKPLHDLGTIKRVVVSTYQSVSGAGKAGMDDRFADRCGKRHPDPDVRRPARGDRGGAAGDGSLLQEDRPHWQGRRRPVGHGRAVQPDPRRLHERTG